jgi:hypothetical protein
MLKKLKSMSTTILNFKKLEVTAATCEEAKEMVSEHFHVNKDATQAFKNWKAKQTGVISENMVKEFMLDYVYKNGKNCPGVGYMITLDAAVKDTRNRPYKVENVKHEGKSVLKKVYRAINPQTGEVLAESEGTKADILKKIKDLYQNGKLKQDVNIVKLKIADKDRSIVAKCKYTPSKNTKSGTWLAFGIEK